MEFCTSKLHGGFILILRHEEKIQEIVIVAYINIWKYYGT